LTSVRPASTATQDCRRISGAQFEPRPEPWAISVGSLLDEFDAEMPAAPEIDDQHRLGHGGMLDGAHRPAAERDLEVPRQLLALQWTSREMRVVPEGDVGNLRWVHARALP
jgi:hypothetical protein